MSKKTEKKDVASNVEVNDIKSKSAVNSQKILQPKMSPKMGTTINMQPMTATREEEPDITKTAAPVKEILYNGEKPKWKGKMDMSSAAMYDAPRNIQ